MMLMLLLDLSSAMRARSRSRSVVKHKLRSHFSNTEDEIPPEEEEYIVEVPSE
jgi:hypothetical protein